MPWRKQKRCASASWPRQPPASTASCPSELRFAVAQVDQTGDPRLNTARDLANVGLDGEEVLS
jgi:hypothetical protein